MTLTLKALSVCRWDCVGLGEVMLRFDPGEGRIHTRRSFEVWEGGGEYNVCRGLRRCFGLRTAFVTAFADNPIGRLIEDLMLQGGVDTSLIRWLAYDGIGRSLRNGLYFAERGFGPRAGVACFDRGHTAIAQLQPSDVNWDAIFSSGVRWFHTGGIFAALSAAAPQIAAEAIAAAHRRGTPVSYDMNHRASLWREYGGDAQARAVNTALVAEADVLFGSEADFSLRLGVDLSGVLDPGDRFNLQAHAQVLHRVSAAFPNLKAVVCALRESPSASSNRWGAICIYDSAIYEVPMRTIEILDRVGGGDAFGAGFIAGLLDEHDPAWALRCAVAHGALTMSTPGDASMVTRAEVEQAMTGSDVRMAR